MNLLPSMEHYTTLSRNINKIIGNNKMTDTLVFAYLQSRMNYKTFIADNVTEKEISYKLGIPLDTIENIIPRLTKNQILFNRVETDKKIENKEYKTSNKYHFHKLDENFFYIYNSFFRDDLGEDSCKLKGFLL